MASCIHLPSVLQNMSPSTKNALPYGTLALTALVVGLLMIAGEVGGGQMFWSGAISCVVSVPLFVGAAYFYLQPEERND